MTDIFSGKISDIDSVSIDEPAKQSQIPDCIYYSTQYQQAAESAKADGDNAAVSVYQLLSSVCSCYPKYDDQSQPYGPMVQMGGRRSALPDDLTDADLEALKVIVTKTGDPSLKARILDVLWLRRKDHQACAAAVAQYVKSAELLDMGDNWTYTVQCYKRALQLAGKLGYDKPLYNDTISNLCAAIRSGNHGKTGFRTVQLMQVLRESPTAANYAAEFGNIAKTIAESAEGKSNSYLARAYWEVAAEWFKLAKNATEEHLARVNVGECYVSEAENRMETDNNGALAAAVILQDGIEALRRASADKSRIQSLRNRLSNIQQQSIKQMKQISTEVDISEIVRRARSHVQNRDFQVALLRFAFGAPLSKPEKVRKQVLELADKFPLSHLMSASQVDERGRVIAIKGSLLGDQAKQESVIEAEMFSHVSRFDWHMQAVSFIEPARQQIANDHHPNLSDLMVMVANNPFIPSGHEEIFLRGLYAGFNGDYLISSHLLVPQIENSIRYALEAHGVDVSNLMSDGTQPVKVLGTLLTMPETAQILGDDMVFTLRGLLIEKTGFDFRNRLCHGFSSSGECYSAAAVFSWWVVLRLCLLPTYSTIKSKGVQSPKGDEATESDNRGQTTDSRSH